MKTTSPRSPSVFISYSWDDRGHRRWVGQLARRLRTGRINVVLDQWDVVPGDQLPHFIEQAIRTSKFVLVICTPGYKRRSERPLSGVRYEGDIMKGELIQKGKQRKFIPVLRRGAWRQAAPWWLAGKLYVDLRDGPQERAQFKTLLSTLRGTSRQPPPVGRRIGRSTSPVAERVKNIIGSGGHGGATHDELRVLWSVHAAGPRGITHERIHESIFSSGPASLTRVPRALGALVASKLVVSEQRNGVTFYRLTPAAQDAL